MAQCGYMGKEHQCPNPSLSESDYCGLHKRLAEATRPEPVVTKDTAPEPAVGLQPEQREYFEGAKRERRRREPPSPPEPVTVDPMVVGGAIQQLLLKQQASEQLRRAQARQKVRDSEGYELPDMNRPAPFKVVPRRRQGDPTMPVDPGTGQAPESLRAGWDKRWVRERDHMDRPTQARVAEFLDYGYEVVLNGDGSECRSRLGLLMQGPPEQYALRASDNTPKGATMRDDALLMAMEMAETANRMAGEQVANVYVDAEHKSERVLVGPNVQPAPD